MKVSVSSKCTACGIYTKLCPEIFDIFGNQVIANPEKISGQEENCIDAALNCPFNAIKISDW